MGNGEDRIGVAQLPTGIDKTKIFAAKKVATRMLWVWGEWVAEQATDQSSRNPFNESLCLLVKVYLAFSDNRSNVERDLGQVVCFLHEHCGPLEEHGTTVNDLFVAHTL